MANLIYQLDQTPITWLSSTGTHLLTLTSQAANSGRQGAEHDFGDLTARGARFLWRFWMKHGAQPVLDEAIGVYQKKGDGTRYDNDDGTGDIAVSSINKLKNLDLLKSVFVDEAIIAKELSKSGVIIIRDRYWMPVIWNATADIFSATALDMGFSLTPVPGQIQAAA